jgi:hypothetical protein
MALPADPTEEKPQRNRGFPRTEAKCLSEFLWDLSSEFM